MFQAAQVALPKRLVIRATWSHSGLQALFTTELIQRHKRYPAALRDYLASALVVRQTADYGHAGVSQRIAQRMVRRAAQFVQAVEEAVQR